MHIGRRHRAAVTAAVFGTALGVTPLQSAAAETTKPALSLHTSEAIDVHGTAGDVDITLTVPPEADSYLLLTLGAPGDENLTVTDDTGAPVTTHQLPGRPRYAEFGKADSDHDGVPGAALTPGTIHLHVAADGLVARTLYVGAYVVDGATDTLWNARGTSAEATMTVGQALLGSTWTSPGQGSGWQPTIPVVTGQAGPAEIRLETRMTMRKPPPRLVTAGCSPPTRSSTRATPQASSPRHYRSSTPATAPPTPPPLGHHRGRFPHPGASPADLA